MNIPYVTYLAGRNCWRLEAPYQYRDEATNLLLPLGFCFDLASIPRCIWWAIAPFELSIVAPLVHDYLYQCAGLPAADGQAVFSRRAADDLFLRIMCREGVARWRRELAYHAVRAFGARHWGRA